MANGVSQKQSVRPPTVAGTFYPDRENHLRSLLGSFFGHLTPASPTKEVKALIAPHAGYIYSGQTAAYGFARLAKENKRRHFVIVGPSHNYGFTGLCANSFQSWETPLGRVKHVSPGQMEGQVFLDDLPHLPEHSVEVEIPFLQYLFSNFSVSCFLTGYQLEPKEAAEFLSRNYSEATFIFSSDLSHYLPLPKAEETDRRTIEAILKLDGNYLRREENSACGREGILILMEMAKRTGWQGRLIKYDTSATASGDTAGVVGYAAIEFV